MKFKNFFTLVPCFLFLILGTFTFFACSTDNKPKSYFNTFTLDQVESIEIVEYVKIGENYGIGIQKQVSIDKSEKIQSFYDCTFDIQKVENYGKNNGNSFKYGFIYSLKDGTRKSFRFNGESIFAGNSGYCYFGETNFIPYKYFTGCFNMYQEAIDLLKTS